MKQQDSRPVLVAEDNDEDFEAIEAALRGGGYENPLRRVATGEQCLDLVQREIGATASAPAFLLLDLNLPGMDGREILEEIKNDPQFKNLPVIVFSTSTNPADIATCYQLGANSYQTKPLEAPAFAETVRNIASYWLDTAVLPQSGTKRLR